MGIGPLPYRHGSTGDAAVKDIARLNKWNRMRLRCSRFAEAIAWTCFHCYEHCVLLFSGHRDSCTCRQWAILHLIENTRVRLRESRRTVSKMTNRQLDCQESLCQDRSRRYREGVRWNTLDTKLIKTLGRVPRNQMIALANRLYHSERALNEKNGVEDVESVETADHVWKRARPPETNSKLDVVIQNDPREVETNS